jgi:hypothetical protein
MNSRVSRQWLLERYAMNAVSVHGEGDVLARISCSLGRRRQYGPVAERASGIATLSAGCDLCD